MSNNIIYLHEFKDSQQTALAKVLHRIYEVQRRMSLLSTGVEEVDDVEEEQLKSTKHIVVELHSRLNTIDEYLDNMEGT